MGDDLLKKLKGFPQTSVFHSNTNPYAAAAIAGMMAARSQEAGPYFRLSDTFVPMLAARIPEEHNTVPDANQIDLDFKNDWIDYCEQPDCQRAVSSTRTSCLQKSTPSVS
jgi:hypothetical protein